MGRWAQAKKRGTDSTVHGGLPAGPGPATWTLFWDGDGPGYFAILPTNPGLPGVVRVLARWRNPGDTASGFVYGAFGALTELVGFELELTCLCRLNWVDAGDNIVSLDSDTKSASQ